jgi:hypothetical protein
MIVLAGCGQSARQHPLTDTPSDVVTIDFLQATSTTRGQLAQWLIQQRTESESDSVPFMVTLQNSEGDYLIEGRVIVAWESGSYRLLVPRSGIIGFHLDESQLDGLSIIAPRGFDVLKQRTFPFGNAYVAERQLDIDQLPFAITDDNEIITAMREGLLRMRAQGEYLDHRKLRDQLRRRAFPLEVADPADAELSPAQIYQRCRDSVVIIGTLDDKDDVTYAGGVILDASGVIATGYHVLDKPPSHTARAVGTAGGEIYRVDEVLAASKAADVAVIRIGAQRLQAAPLSSGDAVGTPVTVISHPGNHLYSLTCGHITRYWSLISCAELTTSMLITAEFGDGASGGPVFNPQGAVTGLVSSTNQLKDQMVFRNCVPAWEIRRLLESPASQE